MIGESNQAQGQLQRADGHLHLRFVRRLGHPPAKVWQALAQAEHLAAWFPTTIDGARVTGAALQFTFRHSEGPAFEGKLLRYEPPSLLEFRWGDETLRFELEPDAEGTRLIFVTTFDVLGKAARDAAGWHSCLDLLSCHLNNQSPPWTTAARWQHVHPGYVDRLGPEASTIGPPQPLES